MISIFSVATKSLLLMLAIISAAGLVIASTPALVGAQDRAIEDICANEPTKSSPVCQDLNNGGDPVSGDDSLFIRVFNALSFVAGVIAVIIIVVGGIQMMTSDGDSQKFANARNLLIYAFVGILIVFFAQAIVRVIINTLIE